MKKISFLLSFVCFVCIASLLLGQSKKENFMEDLMMHREITQKAHSGLTLYTSKETFDSLYTKAKSDIDKGLINSTRDFYTTISSIHTKINCGHSSFYPSDQLFEEIDTLKKCFFPYEVTFLKDTLVIKSGDDLIPKGTQILSINGMSVEKITKEAFQLISSDGYNITYKYRQLESNFSLTLFYLYGQQEVFKLDIQTWPESKIRKISVKGLPVDSGESSEGEEDIDMFKLTYMDDKTALLEVHTFYTETPKSVKTFFNFLKNSFKEIKEKEIKTLILDIRDNTGGNDGNDMELASYLINQHIRDNKYRKINTIDLPPFPKYLSGYWYEMMEIPQKSSEEDFLLKIGKELNRHFVKGEDNAYYYKENKTITKKPSKNVFTGNLYVLINGNVFSGGSLFSALVRDKTDAIFIGEETGGGYYRHTGSIPLIYELPHSGLIFSLFIVINEQDVDQQLMPYGRGLIPQHIVYPSIKEFMEGQDVVMNTAKGLISHISQ